jgi:magnesium-transporting ATPase (P-type)
MKQTSFHLLSPDESFKQLQCSESGLSSDEASNRLHKYGLNLLRPPKRKTALQRFLLQFHNVLIYVLLASAIITFLMQHVTDSIIILSVIFINAIIGYIQEGKAEKSLEALRQMLSLQTQVMRDKQLVALNAELLVPGDVVLLQAGDKVPADIRLIKSNNLEIQEAVLTGESQSVAKDIEPVSQDTSLAERTCMAYAGTYITKGQANGIVVGTGDNTEIGQVSTLLHNVEETETPLIRRMNVLAKKLTLLILTFSALLFIFGIAIRGLSYEEMFMAVIGIAVSAIPEGLPAVITITLAIGVQRMAKKQAIIRKLPAVESLGCVNVICTDKTGTLTRNELSVRHVVTNNTIFEVSGNGYAPEGKITLNGKEVALADYPALYTISLAALLNNDAEITFADGSWMLAGDPTEGALLAFALKFGHNKADMQHKLPRKDVIPFDASYAFMATLHRHENSKGVVYIKGAPEKLLSMCDKEFGNDGKTKALDVDYWQQQLQMLALQGERVLAIAYIDKDVKDNRLDFSHLEGMVLLGMTGIADSPREEAKQSIAACYSAGISVKMITGDHAITASAIGKELGIQNSGQVLTGKELESLSDDELAKMVEEVNIYARATPKHKLRLIAALQSKGHIVAMTGDGVNDAPALKKADIGVAMGRAGTEVAKEAAEIVLTDDNFATIVHAIEEGRTIFNNIRKSIAFILATDGAEAGVIIVAILAGMTQLPISPIQILWVNMITAVTLSLALSVEKATPDIMSFKPRLQTAPFFGKAMILQSVFVSVLIMSGTLGIFWWEISNGSSYALAQTMAVNTLVMFQVFYLLSIRNKQRLAFSMQEIEANPYILLSIIIVVIFQALFTYAPFMQKLFSTAPLDIMHWCQIILISCSIFVFIEGKKWIFHRIPKNLWWRQPTSDK